MKVTYIDHSCFLVELDRHYLLFDYFQGELPLLDSGKPLLVFASHRHGDHFAPIIFSLAAKYPRTQYVISDDIWQNRVPEELYGQTLFMGPDEEEELDEIKIRTFHSTDEGVAFLIDAEGKTIYHAGDLNYWYWKEEADSWNQTMKENYHRELDKMKGISVDVAFLPTDSRLEEYFYLGADDFMKWVGAKLLFPMHFWEDYTVGGRWKALPCALEYQDKIIEIKKKGEEFFFD